MYSPPCPNFWQCPGQRTQPLTHRQVTTIGSLPLYSRSVSCHSSSITEGEGGSISLLSHPFKCKMCTILSCILTWNKQVVNEISDSCGSDYEGYLPTPDRENKSHNNMYSFIPRSENIVLLCHDIKIICICNTTLIHLTHFQRFKRLWEIHFQLNRLSTSER